MRRREETFLQFTHAPSAAHFHKVVDCQWACPAHTPVPEYIRLIAQGRYADAYMVNWVSNVFPGVLGRTCDRPCEPACRRSRVEDNNGNPPEPVAICRLKRVAADHKGEVRSRMPSVAPSNGRRVACVGAGPASLTVARDLAPRALVGRKVGPHVRQQRARERALSAAGPGWGGGLLPAERPAPSDGRGPDGREDPALEAACRVRGVDRARDPGSGAGRALVGRRPRRVYVG